MSDVFTDQLVAVHAELARITSEPKRALAPYCDTSRSGWQNKTANPPQVRWHFDELVVVPIAVAGSSGRMTQNVTCKIWGADRAQCIRELEYVIQALKNTTSTTFADDGLAATWTDEDADDAQARGNELSFTLALPALLDEIGTITSSIHAVTCSMYQSGSAETFAGFVKNPLV